MPILDITALETILLRRYTYQTLKEFGESDSVRGRIKESFGKFNWNTGEGKKPQGKHRKVEHTYGNGAADNTLNDICLLNWHCRGKIRVLGEKGKKKGIIRGFALMICEIWQ